VFYDAPIQIFLAETYKSVEIPELVTPGCDTVDPDSLWKIRHYMLL
tara:strand:- start:866 stop:1003 length:138 start_codon:yes stop_codon:yes gene_type:complete